MDARELHHAAKLQEWEGRIRECRSSGKTVGGWCREHGINAKYNGPQKPDHCFQK